MKKWFKRGWNKDKNKCCNCPCGGGLYFLGFLGALIFYLQQGQGFLGFLKAIVWPVFAVMKILGL